MTQFGQKEVPRMQAAGITWVVAAVVAIMALVAAAQFPAKGKAAMRGTGIPMAVGTSKGSLEVSCPDLVLGTAAAVGMLPLRKRMWAAVGQTLARTVPTVVVAALVLGLALQAITERAMVGAPMPVGPLTESLEMAVAVVVLQERAGAIGDVRWCQFMLLG